MTSLAVTIAKPVNNSHHEASSANSAKNNSVTPIFLYVTQLYMEKGTTTESLKKISGADFNQNFYLGPQNPILKKKVGSPDLFFKKFASRLKQIHARIPRF